MELSPEVRIEKDRIEVSGVPKNFFDYVRGRLFVALQASIPSLSITETPESQVEDLVKVEFRGIDKLDAKQSELFEQTMDRFYLALHRLIESLNDRCGNEFVMEKLSHTKRAIVSIEVPKDKDHPHRDSALKFLGKFEAFARASNRLIAVPSYHIGTGDTDELFIGFSEDVLCTAAYALELFFGTARVYYDPDTDCYLKLHAPSGPSDVYHIVITEEDPTLPSPVGKVGK